MMSFELGKSLLFNYIGKSFDISKACIESKEIDLVQISFEY